MLIHRLLIDPRLLLPLTAAFGLSLTDGADDRAPLGGGSARYEVTFLPSWNPATNPIEYPTTHAKQGLLTPPIGATHDATYQLFCAGTTPTPGLERLSEMGKHDPLDQEIEAAQKRGSVGALIRFKGGSPGPVHPAVSSAFVVDAEHPNVSLVGMIAPSPDWFYGASSVTLQRDGEWVPSMVVPAFAWDSGGDGGTTYLAEDMDLQPKQKTRRADSEHFMRNGQSNPVGYFVFKQLPQDM